MASTARIEELRKKYEENQRRYFAPLANEYRKAGQLEEAIALCRAWLPQQPGHMSGHIVFGQTLFEAGELSEARSVFETALELDPENLIALRHLGDIAKRHGELDAARSWYKRVLDADPRNDEIAALLEQIDSLSAGAAPGDGESAEPEAASPGEPVVEAAPLVLDASIEVTVQPDSADTAAWGSASALEGGSPSTPDEHDESRSVLDVSAGTVAFDSGSSPLESELSPLASDAIGMAGDTEAASGAFADTVPASGAGIHNDVAEDAGADASAGNELGLEVMEFVPPPRDSSRSPRGEPDPFDGHLLTDDADGSGATPAAFVTETMAELYLQQGFRDEALGVYRQLLQQNPDDEGLRERVAQLESGSRSSVGMAAISDEVIESAQRRQAAHTPPSMRSFLARLAVRRAPRRGPGPITDSGEGEEGEDGSQGAPAEPVQPTPDAGLPGIDNDPAAWQLTPDEGSRASADESPYAPDVPDPDADTAEWIAEDTERLSVGGTLDKAFGEDSSPETVGGATTGPGGTDTASPEPAPDDIGPPRGRGASNGTAASAPSATQRTVGAVGTLFSGAVVQAGDEAAANALASAFAPQPEKSKDTMAGRPTRAANSEISLDHVFRESGSRPAASKERSSFSFDQFFSENASGGVSPGGEASNVPDDDAPGDDIEQFNSWLEGLKKK